MKQRGASSSDTAPREASQVSPPWRPPMNHDSLLRNAKSKQRPSSKTPRLTIILLTLFALFGWIQWFLAVAYFSNDVGIGGGVGAHRMRVVHHSQSDSVTPPRRTEERRLVHQIQLKTDSANSLIHVGPKQGDFVQDWLGKYIEDHDEPQDECQPRLEWQLLPENTPVSSCNLIHELQFEKFVILGCGNDRCAVRIQDAQGQDVALKIMRDIQHYDEEDYYAGWMDIVVTERLSSSPVVISPYASCGLSLVTEHATNATLMDHILLARRRDEDFLNTPETRLKIAHQVAFALATLHGMDGFHDDHIASVAHNDVCARQFLYTNDGIYKLFDFDSASFTKFDKNKRVCLERPEHMDDEWDKIKAPEEFHRHARKDLILKYKADVWVLGDVLYYILTKQWVFEGISRNEAKLRMLAGIRSEIQLDESDSPLDQTIVAAIEMAWTLDADERPSAGAIASFLHDKLEQDYGQPDAGEGTVWRVSIPPLPADYTSTFDDFYENLN